MLMLQPRLRSSAAVHIVWRSSTDTRTERGGDRRSGSSIRAEAHAGPSSGHTGDRGVSRIATVETGQSREVVAETR